LVQTSLAINTDVGIRRDRLMTDDELVEYMRRQIEAAAKLGFPIARVQISLTPDSMEALLPVAERYGVVLALEVHAHQHARHPAILALRDRYEKLGSPLLGFTADWGATVAGFAPSLVEAYRRRGASPELIDAAIALWEDYYRQGPPMTEPEHGQRFGAFIELAARHGRPDLGIDMAINGTGLFGPAPVESSVSRLSIDGPPADASMLVERIARHNVACMRRIGSLVMRRNRWTRCDLGVSVGVVLPDEIWTVEVRAGATRVVPGDAARTRGYANA
jgi:hypothetical protein